MGLRILSGTEPGGTFPLAVLWCSTTDLAFGPVFYGCGSAGKSAEEEAEAFIEWLPLDAREYVASDLADLYAKFREELEGDALGKEKP